MMFGAKQMSALRGLLNSFVLLAVFVRALIPAGFMPDNDGSHLLSFEVCGSRSGQILYLDLATGELTSIDDLDGDTPEHGGDSVCIFAGLHLQIPQPQQTAQDAVVVSGRQVVAQSPGTLPYLNATAPPLPARGPPALS